MRIRVKPRTALGRISALLLALFVAILLVTSIVIVGAFNQTRGETFTDNLYISLPMLAAGISAIAAAVTGAISIFKQGERSVLVGAASLIGLLVLWFLIGEAVTPH